MLIYYLSNKSKKTYDFFRIYNYCFSFLLFCLKLCKSPVLRSNSVNGWRKELKWSEMIQSSMEVTTSFWKYFSKGFNVLSFRNFLLQSIVKKIVSNYRDLRLSKGRRNFEIFGDQNVSEIVLVLDTPYSQPFDVVYSQILWQNYFNVFSLISS